MTALPRWVRELVDSARPWFWGCLAMGLLLRLAIVWQSSDLGTTIVDEQQYSQLASNILAGNGFGWGPGRLTSIRPPLFPAVLAAVWAVAGDHSFQAVRILHVVLGLITTGVVYVLARRVGNSTSAQVAAVISWLYPSAIFFTVLMLTETLFTLLLLAFVLATVALVQSPRPANALWCGVTLALAALTRSVLWPLPLLLCPLLVLFIAAPAATRVRLSALVFVSYAVVMAPWAIRNTRLQEVFTVVDTMGGINLRMGNYEHTPDDRMWDAVSIAGEKNWVYGFAPEPGQAPTEGRKDKWAQRKAIEYIVANPGTTVRRSLIKFADFWGLEREFISGVREGFFQPPVWFQAAAIGSILLAYVAIVVAGAAGAWLATPADWRMHAILLLPVVLITGIHTLVFAHSRYHVPLIPILGIYAASFLVRLPAFRWTPGVATTGAILTIAVALTIWLRQILIVDLPRLTAFLEQVG